MENDNRIAELEEKVCKLEEELQSTKEHLKRYTAPASRKQYYQNNKELVKERISKCRPTSEQLKVYNRRAYLKRKEKLKEESEKENL
jgi:hypothetical protein|uniref:Uncharacterized protein n=1 Tax=viral metagenome TaxID=1070528 RepID=A0A6C0IR05_9ZZZZ